MRTTKKISVPKAPTGDEYEPGVQLRKAKKKGVASTEKVVKNIL